MATEPRFFGTAGVLKGEPEESDNAIRERKRGRHSSLAPIAHFSLPIKIASPQMVLPFFVSQRALLGVQGLDVRGRENPVNFVNLVCGSSTESLAESVSKIVPCQTAQCLRRKLVGPNCRIF